VQFSFTYPLVAHPYDPRFVTKDTMTAVAQAAEQAGFGALAFTDHPVPSDRWLKAGGHDALDPFAALCFVAAVTDRLRLLTNIAVLPYRNPFLLAKSVATVDVLSGGRMILGAAVGYQKAEYKALGVDFEERNALFDEAVEAIVGIWTTDDFAMEGRHFTALGQTANPKPVQRPHPPIWIGGNSMLARRRAARYGQGWNPFPAPRVMATTSRTVPCETVEDFAELLDGLRVELEKQGRSGEPFDLAFSPVGAASPGTPGYSAQQHLDVIGRLGALGVNWIGASVPGDDPQRCIDALLQYGEEVVSRA
jgi:probable F420-dependent oxidoreductase